jgi:3-oxoacyl-[acyl-carrier protein] reductase
MSLDDFRLNGKKALVCGASKGIGRAIAIALSEAGSEVILLARTRENLVELQNELKPAKTHVLALDLDRPLDVVNGVKEFIARHGDIHILINNAAGPAPGPILEAEAEQFLSAFNRHILAAQLLTRLLLPGMKSAGYGRIVNIISTSVREPIVNLGVSNTIRGAMASWSKTVASELPPGITINNILPGYTATDRLVTLKKNLSEKRRCSPEDIEREWIQTIPEGRIAKPSEIANAALFLASPAASYVRGISLAVDGGRTRSL